MPLKGVHCVKGYVNMADHYDCMVNQPGPPCGIEPRILMRITDPGRQRDNEGVVFSPSTLSACHRRTALTGQYDWFMDVRAGYKMVRGSIIHDGMQNDPPYPGIVGIVTEIRMSAPINVNGQEEMFKGKADLVVLKSIESKPVLDDPVVDVIGDVEIGHPETFRMKNILHIKIADYKTKSSVGHELIAPARDNEIQINAYAWLAERFLPGWLNLRLTPEHEDFPGWNDYREHLQLNEGQELPYIDEVVVDELVLYYMDMSKSRAMTSEGFLYTEGKMLGDRDQYGKWKRRIPTEYAELEIKPVMHFSRRHIEKYIKDGIAAQIEGTKMLAPPLTGDEAKLKCNSCPVKQVCYETGLREGYSMEDQRPYIGRKVEDE